MKVNFAELRLARNEPDSHGMHKAESFLSDLQPHLVGMVSTTGWFRFVILPSDLGFRDTIRFSHTPQAQVSIKCRTVFSRPSAVQPFSES